MPTTLGTLIIMGSTPAPSGGEEVPAGAVRNDDEELVRNDDEEIVIAS